MIKLISAFEKEVLLDCSEHTSRRQLVRYLKSPNVAVVVLYDDSKKICAYGIGSFRRFKKPSGRILKLAVRKDVRRKGFGMMIVNCLECFFLQKSATKVFAEVRQSNTASIMLFQKSGYKISGTLYGYYGCQNESYNLEDGLKFLKELSK